MAPAQHPPNRLIGSTSPYLLQHAHNPVDWYPWGEEALRRSAEEDRPIFLSIGYAACHWCHVMERESFENPAVAELLNREFVPIKVDREERPDLDEIYMAATQLMTGSGGWPMSVFLTPERKPFFAGTYFPPEDRWGRPGFSTLLREIARAWREQRRALEKQAAELTAAVDRVGAPSPGGPLGPELVREAAEQLLAGFDPVNGGFGGAPKFPPSMRLELLLRQHQADPDPRWLRPVALTLDRMARGGMYDQVGGGFHRYSVDAAWLVPHFEKMLYDNALLARLYALAYEATGEWYWGRVAREVLDYVIREMTHREGGFYSSTDADSEGEEGRFFLWTPAEVGAVLGAEEGDLFDRVYEVTARGNFEGRSIPNLLARGLDGWAAELGSDPAALEGRLAASRRRLWEERERRVHPLLDDKVLAAWNGLMIRALAEGYRVFRDERYRQAGERAAEFILTRLRRDGRLLRAFREGAAHLPAYLEDYAFMAAALLDLAAAGAPRWRDEGLALLQQMDALFWDASQGLYYFTSHDHESLISRPLSATDDAIPSGASMAALAFARAAEVTGDRRWERRAREILEGLSGGAAGFPAAFPNLLVAAGDLFRVASARPALPAEEAVRVDAWTSHAAVPPGGSFRAAVRLEVAGGHHVNSHEPRQPYLVPTALSLAEGGPFELAGVSYPPGEEVLPEHQAEPLSVYHGTALLAAELQVPAGAAAGAAAVELRLRFQACSGQQCFPPAEVRLVLPVRIGDARGPEQEPELFARLPGPA